MAWGSSAGPEGGGGLVGSVESMMTPTRGLPPKISRAAVSRAPRWFWISQSRVYLFGAAIRRSSPSSAASRHGRTHESTALAGKRRSSSVSMRSHKESSISGTLYLSGAGSYTQSYPQLWITVHGRELPGGGAELQATKHQVATSHRLDQRGRERLVLRHALRPSAGQSGLRGAREHERAHVTIGANGAARGSRALTCLGAGQ